MAKKGHATTPLKPEELGGLYPSPKTLEEREVETEARQEYFDTIRTRMAAFKIAFFGSILCAPVAYYAVSVEALWTIGSMPIIIFSYVVWAIMGMFALKWIRYTANIFYEYSRSPIVFWALYITAMGAAIYAWHQGLWLASNSYYWIGVLAAVQFIVPYISAKLLIRHR